MVKEYFTRQMLAKVGITGPSTAELPYVKAVWFETIAAEVEKFRKKQIDEKRTSAG